MKQKIKSMTIFTILIITLIAGIANASISLDGVSTYPSIIAAGDEIDIILNFQDKSSSFANDISKISEQGDYQLHVWIEPSDTVSKNYMTFLDAEGNRNIGHLFTGDVWRKNFRVKVADNAPTGNYEIKALFRYEKNGKMLDALQIKYFTLNVKKEGIVLGLAGINTIPTRIKPGYNYATIIGNLENSGLKDAKNVEIKVILPEGFEHSYSNNNRVYAGLVIAGTTTPTTFTIDVDENIIPGEHVIKYEINYKDMENNVYTKQLYIPIYIKEKPIIEVISYEGEGLAGNKGELRITIKNTGFEAAESVDVRIIKQNSQAFDFDVRSNYVGELQPGEEGLAIFDIDVNSDAEIKVHDFKVLIRAKGDSDQGDDTIYTYNRRAKFEVTGQAPNNLLIFGMIAGAVFIIGLLINKFIKKD